jgi:membrane protein DedA with SNARE-associated domain
MEIIFAWIQRFADNSLLLFCTIFSLSLVHMFCPPIPLESLTVFSSYIAGTGHGSLLLIWIATTTGMSVGSIVMYRLAFIKGEALLNWGWLKKHLNPQAVEKARIWFQHYGIWTIYIGKCITGMSFVVVFCCGLFKVEQRKASITIICSNSIYYGILVLLGRYLGRKWQTFTSMGSKFAFGIGLFFLLLTLGGIFYFLWTHRKIRSPESKG